MNSPVKHWRDTKKLSNRLGLKGRLLLWTKIYTPPLGFEYQAPYFAGIIELETGQKVPGQIVDCLESDLKPGLKLRSVVRRLRKPQANDVIEYGIKFTPTAPLR